jgi:hypothetical protein
MAIQFSTALRNARLDTVEITIGASPTLELRTGAPPASVDDADSGSLLATLTPPADWMAAAASGVKGLAGTWSGAVSASGTAGHFRLKSSGGTPHLQGTVSQREADGGAGDLKLAQATAALVAGQALAMTSFDLTEGNA